MKFAVVGRANKGKSSIVATLVENDEILISPLPGTTRITQEFNLKVGDLSLFSIIDTPGFEEAPAVLDWLKQAPVSANQRPQRVRQFYETFRNTDRYQFECELLKPILDGAAILYVVDASHPYRPNFEAEFEILQWTGQPSIALLNQTGDGQWIKDWQNALGQYFRKSLIFNAHTARFAERIRIMEELRFLSDETRPVIDKAIELLRTQHDSRLQAVSLNLASFVGKAITHSSRLAIKDDEVNEEEKRICFRNFYNELRLMEKESREAIAQVFNYKNLETDESNLNPEQHRDDLFGKETWEFLGLSRAELIAIGTLAGALAGGTIDASVGGASFMAGSGIGAVLGGLGTGYLAFSNLELAGWKLSKKYLVVGPITNPNFPWILLDRGMFFIQSVLMRTHAQRGILVIDEKHKGPTSLLSKKDKGYIVLALQGISRNVLKDNAYQSLASMIRKALSQS